MSHRRIVVVLGGVALLSLCIRSVADAAIVTRVQEPVVIAGDRLPAFAGFAVDRIIVYKKTPTGWVEVPTQIDERTVSNLKQNLTTVCQYDHDPCELQYVLSGSEGNGLDSDDELAIMAREAAGSAASTHDWVGIAGLDTLDQRYQILVYDPINNESGYVYAYAWLRSPDHTYGQVDDYVNWSGPGSESCRPAGEASCGWIKATDQGSANGVPRMNLYFPGNWTTSALCVRTAGDDGSCATASNAKNLMDALKWRTKNPNESEYGWDRQCRAFLGVKDGPVRVIRLIQGAESGRYTTKTELGYGTWLEQTVNLRVHPIGSVDVLHDQRVPNPSQAPGEALSLLFTKSFSAAHDDLAMDGVDGATPSPVSGTYDDWVQYDSGRGTYLSYIEEERSLGIVTRAFDYTDLKQQGQDDDNFDFQDGLFGQFGFMVSGSPYLPSYEDFECVPSNPEDPTLNFARISRTLIPAPIDSAGGDGKYRSEEGARYDSYRRNPLYAALNLQAHVVPLPPIDPVCTPQLSGVAASEGTRNTLGLNTANCGNGFSGSLLYRGVTPGDFSFVVDLGTKTSFVDMSVRDGVTYRYAARGYDRDGNRGPQSAEVVLAVHDSVPPPLPMVILAEPGSQRIVVSWDRVPGRDYRGMYVEVATASAGPYSRVNPNAPVVGDEATFAIANLTPGVTYWVKLKSVDFAGNESAYSAAYNAVPYP